MHETMLLTLAVLLGSQCSQYTAARIPSACTHTPRMSAMSQLAVGGGFEKHDGQDIIKLFNYNTVQSTPRPAQ